MNKFVDIDLIFKTKNPKVYKFLPGFILNYLKKTIHQEELNDFMHRNRDLKGADFCNQVVKEFEINVIPHGLENIPQKGGLIFASNHPLGGMDAMATVSSLSEIRRDIKFIVNDILLNVKNLQGMFVGVNKLGKNATASLQIVDGMFSTNSAIFIFPAGLVSRKSNGLIRDLVWKKTFITRAVKHQKSVIPIFVDGELSNFFYRLSNFRKKIGIKANIEMLYLVDEMYRQKGKTVHIYFGKPIPCERFDDTKSHNEWAEIVKTELYNLKPSNQS